MNRKWMAGLLVFCMVVSLVPGAALAAEEQAPPDLYGEEAPDVYEEEQAPPELYAEERDIDYEQLYGTASVAGGASISGFNADYVAALAPDADGITRIPLVIPSQLGGRDVVRIENDAFGTRCLQDEIYDKVRVTKIDLSQADNLQEIGDKAFYNYANANDVYAELDSVLIFPDGVKTIGSSAFARLDGLKGDLLLPDSIESIGDSAFSWTGLDGTLKLPDNPAYTKVNTQFAYYSPLTAIAGLTAEGVFPSAITELGKNAFGYSNITGDVVLPNTITVLSSAFQGSKIDSLYVPESVTAIASTIIAYCDALKWVRLDFDSELRVFRADDMTAEAEFMASGDYRSDLNVVLNNEDAYTHLKDKTFFPYQNRLTYQTTLSFSGLDGSYDRPVLRDRPINWEMSGDGCTYFENTDYRFPKGAGNAWSFTEGDVVNTVAESDKATGEVLYPVTAEPKVTITTSGNIKKVYDGEPSYFTITAALPEGYELKTSATAKPGDYFMNYQWYSWSQGVNAPEQYTKIYSGPANAIGFSDVEDSLDGSYDSDGIAHGYYVIAVFYKRTESGNTLLRREDIYFTVSIAKAVPDVAPEYPAAAIAGKKLADLPLAAGKDACPGTIAWTEPEKNVLEGGGKYGWQFTPEDAANYETVTGAAEITGANGYGVLLTDSAGVGPAVSQVRADDAVSRVDTQGGRSVLVVVPGERVSVVPGAPAEGYCVSAAAVQRADGGPAVAAERQEDGTYAFVMPDAAVEVTVIYRKEHTVTAAAGAHGAVTPAGAVSAADGTALTFTFTPDYGYKLSRVTVDGVEAAVSGNTLTLTPKRDCAVEAAFEKMAAEDLDEIIGDLPEDPVGGGQSAVDAVLDAKMHYEAVKGEGGAADKASESLNEKLAQLPNVQARVEADPAKAALQSAGSLLENMTKEDAEALKTGAAARFEIVLEIAETEPEEAVRASIAGALSGAEVAGYADVLVKKIITDAQDQQEIVNLSELKKPVVLVFQIPAELRQTSGGVSRNFTVLRTHQINGVLVTEALSDEDGDPETYTVRSSRFSVYTLAYRDTQQKSSGSGGKTSYLVTVADGAAHGTVTADRRYAARNDTVTITARPDAGYALAALTVTGPDGGSILVTDAGNNIYRFEMPGGGVTVEASFSAPDGCVYSDHCAAARFADVPADGWYHEAVDYVVEQGIMQGKSETSFAPFDGTSRGMLAAILYRREGSPLDGAESMFSDVAAERYDAAAIAWASAQGIVKGYDGGLFRPDDVLTRQQLAAILFRYAEMRGYNVSERSDLSAFSDAASISAYAGDAMSWANAAGLISGRSGGVLDPGGKASRSETAAILMRLFRYLEAQNG